MAIIKTTGLVDQKVRFEVFLFIGTSCLSVDHQNIQIPINNIIGKPTIFNTAPEYSGDSVKVTITVI